MRSRRIDKPTASRDQIAALGLCMLLPSLGTSIANVALPALAAAFGASSQHVKWVVLSYLLTLTAVLVIAGRVADIFGARRTLITGVATFGLGSLACGVAPTLHVLIAGRAMQGAGAAVMMTTTLALVRGVMPRSDTAKAMGILGSVSAIGTALGPSLGGVLMATYGWHAVFFVKIPLVLVALVAVMRFIARDAVTNHDPRALRVDLLADRILLSGIVSSALVSTVLMATLIVGPFYLTRALGLHIDSVGLVMSVGPAAAALSAAPSGRVVARFGSARVTVAALLGVLTGSLLFAVLPRDVGLAGYVGTLVILTTAYAAFQTANNTSVMLAAGESQRGVVSGMLNLSRNIGLIAGASLMGSIYSFGSTLSTGGVQIAASMGFRLTFAAAAVVIMLALVATWRGVVAHAAS